MRMRFFWMFAVGCLFAQDTTIRVDVQQVLVPVVVTDHKGHHVTGLRAADFRIFEDGVEQTVASLSTDTSAAAGDPSLTEPASGKAAVATAASGPRHTFVICIDTLHASAANRARLRQTLEEVFDKEKSAGAQYVLVGIGRQLQVLQPATTNPMALVVKVRSAAFDQALPGTDAASLAAQIQNLRGRMEELCKRCMCRARAGGDCDAQVDTLVNAAAERWMAPHQELMAEFESVVEELAKLPTGRTLILVSEGFYRDPKHEFDAAVSAYLPNRPQVKPENSSSRDPYLEKALQIAAERNVIIDTIDVQTGALTPLANSESMDASRAVPAASGLGDMGPSRQTGRTTPLGTSGETANVAVEENATLEQLARASGGLYFRGNGDLQKQMRTALADGRQYYVLAYVPKNGARDGKFRSITVEIRNQKLAIRAKPGYWAASGAQ